MAQRTRKVIKHLQPQSGTVVKLYMYTHIRIPEHRRKYRTCVQNRTMCQTEQWLAGAHRSHRSNIHPQKVYAEGEDVEECARARMCRPH